MNDPSQMAEGYQKLANLMTRHKETSTFQRFDFINTLNLLYLQAGLVHLERDLRASMARDLESRDSPRTSLSVGSASRANGVPEKEQSLGMAKVDSMDAKDETDASMRSGVFSATDERMDPVRDWWYLGNGEDSRTWEIMLQTREKLAEYNEAVLKQSKLQKCDSPNPLDLQFLQRWFKDKDMGDYPLIGADSNLWNNSSESDLIAIRARKGDDPFATLFLDKVIRWWHGGVGHHFKKPLDVESQYFEYKDKNMLRAANVLISLISTAFLLGSILALYFVSNMLIRLGIIAVLTQLFSLTLVLVTNARKVEVFAATAGYVAVQVVFVGSTINSH